MHSHPQPHAQHTQTPGSSRPFLKWSGGKARLLSQLLPLLPRRNRLIEPFVGAGSVFLAAGFERCVINDANPDLIAVWAALQSRPDEFMRRSAEFFSPENHNREAYLRIRGEFNAATERFERAVRVPYLNRFGFNGLFRVNRSGAFNVPYGAPSSLPGFPEKQMAAAADRLKTCVVLNGGFMGAIEQAGCGDVLYCDPPYSPLSDAGSFVSYTAGGFGAADHEMLVEACVVAVSRGAVALISNHDTPATRELYRGWRIEQVSVRRSIAADAANRGVIRELVAILPFEAAKLTQEL